MGAAGITIAPSRISDAAIRLQQYDADSYAARGYYVISIVKTTRPWLTTAKQYRLAPDNATHYSGRASSWLARDDFEMLWRIVDKASPGPARLENLQQPRLVASGKGTILRCFSGLECGDPVEPGLRQEEYAERAFVQQALGNFEQRQLRIMAWPLSAARKKRGST